MFPEYIDFFFNFLLYKSSATKKEFYPIRCSCAEDTSVNTTLLQNFFQSLIKTGFVAK